MPTLARRAVGLFALLTLCAGTLRAQERRLHVVAAGGLEALHTRDGSTFTPGYVGQLGLAWTSPASRLGWQVSAFGFQRERSFAPLGSTSAYRSMARSRVYGLEGTLTYALSRGRVQPYVLGGAGLYRSELNERFADPVAGNLTTARAAQLEPGATVGFGLSMPVGRAQLFLESRYLLLGSRTSGGHHLVPLVVGFRF
jgi:hypothetical protein